MEFTGATKDYCCDSKKQRLVHCENPIQESPHQENLSRERSTKFREIVRTHLQYELSSESSHSAFANLRDVEAKHEPMMAVVSMSDCEHDGVKSVTVAGKDACNISMQQFHQNDAEKETRHTMLVGHVGASKSVTAKKYAEAVSRGQIEALKHIQMVHYIDAATLQVQQNSTAFELLFTEQIGDELTPDLQAQGQEWMTQHARKTLLVIDGLDRTLEEFDCRKCGKIYSATRAKPNVILANIFSGALYKGLSILSTSRPRIFWNMEPIHRPQKVVALRGFSDASIRGIIYQLVPQKAENILRRLKNAPQLHSLCTNPMFLIYTTQILASFKETPITESAILASVLLQYSSSGHSDADINVLMKLAYHGIKDNRFTFTARYVETLGISMEELKGPIAVGAVLTPFQDRPDKDDLRWQFPHQSIQEVLAAMYPFNFIHDEFMNYAKYDLAKPGMDMALKMLFGIVWNPETQKIAQKYIQDRRCCMQFWQKTLWEYIMGHIHCGTLKNGRVTSAIYECGPKFLKQLASSVKKIDLDWKESVYPHAILSVINYFAGLKEVYIKRIEVTSHLMPLLAESVSKVEKFKVMNLVVYGAACPECFKLLGKVVVRSNISTIEFDSCQLNVNKLNAFNKETSAELGSILPSSYFQMRVLNDIDMDPSCIKQLVTMTTQRDSSWITFVKCQINKEKLQAVHNALKSSSKKLYYLELIEKNLSPCRSDITNICNIFRFVEKQLQLGDWNLSEFQIINLRKSLKEYKNLKFGLVLTLNGKTASLKRGASGIPDIFTRDIPKQCFECPFNMVTNHCCRMGLSGDVMPECNQAIVCPRKFAKTDYDADADADESEKLLEITTANCQQLQSRGSSSVITVKSEKSSSIVNVNIQILAQTVIKDNASATFNVLPGETKLECAP